MWKSPGFDFQYLKKKYNENVYIRRKKVRGDIDL